MINDKVETEIKKIAKSTASRKPKVSEQHEDASTVVANLTKLKPTKVQERVTIAEPESLRLDKWLEQIGQRFDGFIKLNKSDLVRFLIASHAELLSREELDKIKVENYDEGEFLKWALLKRDEAKKRGDEFNLSDIFNAYKTVLSKAAPSTARNSKNKNYMPHKPETGAIHIEQTNSDVSDLKSEKQPSSQPELP